MKRTIEERLVGLGNIIGAAQRKSVSLSSAERRMQDRLHTEAIQAGMSWAMINGLEMEGERGQRGSMPYPIESRFIGLQDVGMFGLSIRFYNIEGDHKNNGSTVGVSQLVSERIPVLDLSIFGVWREVAKEQFLMAAWFTLSLKERTAGLIARVLRRQS